MKRERAASKWNKYLTKKTSSKRFPFFALQIFHFYVTCHRSILRRGKSSCENFRISFDPLNFFALFAFCLNTFLDFPFNHTTSCQSDDIGFPSFTSATPPGPGSLAYLKSSPYIIAVDSLHAMGYPTAGKSDQTKHQTKSNPNLKQTGISRPHRQTGKGKTRTVQNIQNRYQFQFTLAADAAR